MEIEVRALEPGDLDEVLEIHRQPRCIAGTFQFPHRSPAEIRATYEDPSRGSHRIVAVVDDGGRRRVVGVLGLHTMERRRAHVAELGMFVHDDFQGRGIGNALLGAAIDMARNWLQISRIELHVYVDNTPAIRLYERHGFEREGTHRRYAWRHGEYADSYSMAWLRD